MSEISSTETPRFDVDDVKQLQEGLDYLEEHGYVVFANAANAEDCKHAESLLWDFLEGTPAGIRRDDVTSWGTFPGMAKLGIIGDFGIGQSEFLWFLRGLPKVKKAFAGVWSTDELLTSFDGCGIMRPWQYKENWKTTGSWWHMDQNPLDRPGKQCVQGLVSLYDADETTGSLIVVPGSHKLFDKSFIRSLRAHGDFVSVPPNTLKHMEDNYSLKPKLVKCKAGDLLLWDSRTTHCNTPAEVVPPKSDPIRLLRAVAYICMVPMSMAEDIELLRSRRHLAFVRQCTTSHWPHILNVSSCPIMPNNTLQLNPQQKSLLYGTRGDPDVVKQTELGVLLHIFQSQKDEETLLLGD